MQPMIMEEPSSWIICRVLSGLLKAKIDTFYKVKIV